MMDQLLDLTRQLLNGLQVGSIYALVALGYTMVYGIVKLINFAHGDVIMVGGYVSIVAIPMLVSNGLPAWLCVVAAVAVCSIIGVVSERAAYKPLREAPRISALITAIGVSLFLQNLFMIIFTPNGMPFPNLFDKTPIILGKIQVSNVTLITIVVSILLMVGLNLFVKRTRVGKAMRAVSEDAGAARLMGISVNATISATFAIGSGLAAVASVLYCSSYPLVDPNIGSMLGLKAFVAAVLGGIGIIPGAMLGGLALGIAESLTKAYISSKVADAVVFGILVVVLLVKPSGILGKNVGEKV